MKDYWSIKKDEVETIAFTNGIKIHLRNHDDLFLYDIYDYGNYEPTQEEIIEAIIETFGGN